MNMLAQELRAYLDEGNRLVAWPCLRKYRDLALEYLASQFETGRSYSVQEVNAIINSLHVFDQPALLREEMFANGLLDCTSDGSEYWKVGP
jgi:hypothetical protein